MKNHEHIWRKVNEQSLLAGYYPIGWRCEKCNKFININELSPIGLGGSISSKEEFIGPHGCRINTNTGIKCNKQIIDKITGEITYE